MISIAELPVHHQEMVIRELETGERVEWAGMPVPRYFTLDSGSVFFFAIPWTIFSLCFTVVAVWALLNNPGGPGLLLTLIGIPFTGTGIGMLFSPIRAYRKATRTVYVITDRRAIIFDGGRSAIIHSYPPDKLQDIYRKEHKNGTADVIFTRRRRQVGDGDEQWEEHGFLRVTDSKKIENMLNDVAQTRSFASRG